MMPTLKTLRTTLVVLNRTSLLPMASFLASSLWQRTGRDKVHSLWVELEVRMVSTIIVHIIVAIHPPLHAHVAAIHGLRTLHSSSIVHTLVVDTTSWTTAWHGLRCVVFTLDTGSTAGHELGPVLVLVRIALLHSDISPVLLHVRRTISNLASTSRLHTINSKPLMEA